MQAAEACKDAELAGSNEAVLRRETPILQNVWLCTEVVDNFDGLEGNVVVSLYILLLLAGHEAKSKSQRDIFSVDVMSASSPKRRVMRRTCC